MDSPFDIEPFAAPDTPFKSQPHPTTGKPHKDAPDPVKVLEEFRGEIYQFQLGARQQRILSGLAQFSLQGSFSGGNAHYTYNNGIENIQITLHPPIVVEAPEEPPEPYKYHPPKPRILAIDVVWSANVYRAQEMSTEPMLKSQFDYWSTSYVIGIEVVGPEGQIIERAHNLAWINGANPTNPALLTSGRWGGPAYSTFSAPIDFPGAQFLTATRHHPFAPGGVAPASVGAGFVVSSLGGEARKINVYAQSLMPIYNPDPTGEGTEILSYYNTIHDVFIQAREYEAAQPPGLATWDCQFNGLLTLRDDSEAGGGTVTETELEDYNGSPSTHVVAGPTENSAGWSDPGGDTVILPEGPGLGRLVAQSAPTTQTVGDVDFYSLWLLYPYSQVRWDLMTKIGEIDWQVPAWSPDQDPNWTTSVATASS